MAQDLVGANVFTEQPSQESWTPATGLTTVRRWVGPRALFDSKRDEIIDVLAPDSLTGAKGTPAELVATFLQPEYGGVSAEDSSTWELIPTPVDRPIATHPAFNTSGTSEAIREKIDKAIAEGRAHETDWDTDWGVPGMNEYRDLKAKGTTSYRIWSYVVRRTYTIPRNSIEEFADTDAGKVVAWGDIPFNEGVKFAQPVYNKWDGSTVETTSIDQWLVNPATVRYEFKRYTVTKEWYGAIGWYSVLYDGGNASSDSSGSNLG